MQREMLLCMLIRTYFILLAEYLSIKIFDDKERKKEKEKASSI